MPVRVWVPYNRYQQAELVTYISFAWPVLTVQRLWFGTGLEDKLRSLRALLSVMSSDTPLMLQTNHDDSSCDKHEIIQSFSKEVEETGEWMIILESLVTEWMIKFWNEIFMCEILVTFIIYHRFNHRHA